MELKFYKYQGTGNDFVIIYEKDLSIELTKDQIKNICNRRFGIGADGLMIFKHNANHDFTMIYYNADGKESSMCGNGGRCLVKFTKDHIFKNRDVFTFDAIDGLHEASVEDKNMVKLKMSNVKHIEHHNGYHVLNTGSPHYIRSVINVMDIDVKKEGAEIRYNNHYKEKGINVNFVEQTDDEDFIIVRTYERGVEDETLSCGTGVTAAALVYAHNDNGFNSVNVKTLGGKLFVEFDNYNNEHFENIWLCGPAQMVYSGTIPIN